MNVMIDIETMGTGSNAAILSIGAAKFDPLQDRTVTDSFYARIDLSSSLAAGLTITASTVEWWLHDDRAAARKALAASEAVDLFSAMQGFADWFGPKSLPTWGNGATFDNVIVRNAMERIGVTCPWNFWDDRCFRTMKNIHPLIEPVERPEGVAHHALHDAIYQSFQCQAMWRGILGPEYPDPAQKEPG